MGRSRRRLPNNLQLATFLFVLDYNLVKTEFLFVQFLNGSFLFYYANRFYKKMNFQEESILLFHP